MSISTFFREARADISRGIDMEFKKPWQPLERENSVNGKIGKIKFSPENLQKLATRTLHVTAAIFLTNAVIALTLYKFGAPAIVLRKAFLISEVSAGATLGASFLRLVAAINLSMKKAREQRAV